MVPLVTMHFDLHDFALFFLGCVNLSHLLLRRLSFDGMPPEQARRLLNRLTIAKRVAMVLCGIMCFIYCELWTEYIVGFVFCLLVLVVSLIWF